MSTTRNLILVGPMGAGKTRVGTELAARCGLHAVDADHEIERRAGASVARIFEVEGEAGFRARESAMLAELLAGEGLLLATGGGAVLDPRNRQLLRRRGFVVHLHAGPATQLQRLAQDRSRPLLARADREAVLHELARVREPLYAQVADLRVDTDGLAPHEVVAALQRRLPLQWRSCAGANADVHNTP